MTKRKSSTHGARLTSDARPTATSIDFPIFVPNEEGETKIEIGKGRLRYGTLVIEFKDTVPAVAIQNMIERGVLLGLGMVMLKPDVVNEMYQEVVAEEAAQTLEGHSPQVEETNEVEEFNENNEGENR